jgi:hypothetical protein
MAHIELVNPVGTILEEIADPRMKRDDIAATYAFLIVQKAHLRPNDFRRINHAIIDRWSLNALTYIKDRAWKLVEGRA